MLHDAPAGLTVKGMHTDESRLYPTIRKEFAAHETLTHPANVYGRGNVTTNSVEGFFGILTPGLNGVYHHCGEQHLRRYLEQFTFRYNHRARLGARRLFGGGWQSKIRKTDLQAA